ncbi:MAG: flagellar FliJ family protein, partial [Acidobacteriaceae bacterium]|nr:flagellar FliJ family protein [Acidobacteriaceae bacterium]
MSRHKSLSWLGVSLLTAQLWGAEPPTTSAAASPSSNTAAPTSANDLNNLRERIAQQEEQIKRLQQAVDEQRTLLEKAVAATNAAPSNASADGSATANEVNTVAVANKSNDGPVPIVPAVNVVHPHWALNRAGQKLQAGEPSVSPLGIKIGTTTFTPLGFVDFTWFGRSTNVGSGLGTNFAGIPYNTSATAHLSENNFSAQNSRIGFRVDSTVLGAKVLGYFEADFYGNQPGNVFVSNGAATFRMRNVFVDVQKGKWEVLGGQDWSMFTPNRRGLSPIP